MEQQALKTSTQASKRNQFKLNPLFKVPQSLIKFSDYNKTQMNELFPVQKHCDFNTYLGLKRDLAQGRVYEDQSVIADSLGDEGLMPLSTGQVAPKIESEPKNFFPPSKVSFLSKHNMRS